MEKRVVIVGGGPAGSACAIELKKMGINSVIVEKEEMPRFHIGESMTGECGASVRKLGVNLEPLMEEDGHPIKHGTIVYGADGKNSFYIPVMGKGDDNKLFPQQTWQVKRSKFDKMLFDAAKDMGVETVKGAAAEVIKEGDSLVGVKVNTDGGIVDVCGDFVVDASGQNTFLSRQGVTGEREPGHYGKQVAIFGHFKNAIRDEGETHKTDDTLIMYREQNHWAWFIPVDNETVSIGVVVPADYLKSKKMSKEEFLLTEMPTINVELEKRVRDAELVGEVRGMSNYSYQIHGFTGKDFICIGDAHRFVDPIFSFGLHFALHEGRDSAKAIASYFEGENANDDKPFAEYEEYCESAMDIIQLMLDAFWNYPLAFSLYMKSKKYRDSFIDMFAGRVYNVKGTGSEGLAALKKLIADGEKAKATMMQQGATA